LRNITQLRDEAVHQGTESPEAVKQERGRDGVAGHKKGQGDEDGGLAADQRSERVAAALKKAEQGQRMWRPEMGWSSEEVGRKHWHVPLAIWRKAKTNGSEGSGHTDLTPS
jgi:hypothetical protein